MSKGPPVPARREPPGSFLSHLECSLCTKTETADRLVNTSTCCNACLLPRYDLEAARERVHKNDVTSLFPHHPGLWRYSALLPDPGPLGPVTLLDGDTPVLETPLGSDGVRVTAKDETRNPTGTFKARGMGLAVTRARALGADHLRAPTAGNAGGALAMYAARAGLAATVAMPQDASLANKREVQAAGARLIEVDGLIPDCQKTLLDDPEAKDAFDVSTFREPYRMEGKKTMGFELWEQNGHTWPEFVVFPTGGGLGIVALKKAHDELVELGLEDGPPPRFVAVQSEGCAPIVQAFREGKEKSSGVKRPHTVAGGLRVPTPTGDRMVLRVLRECKGEAVAVSESAIVEGMHRMAKQTGILVGPETGAGVAALDALQADGHLDRGDHVSLFLTGTGLKHMDLFQRPS